jgi:hypothetical protein
MASYSGQESARSAQNAGLFIHFTGQGQGQLTDIRRDAVGGHRADDAGDIQRWPPSLRGLRFGLIDRRPG